MAGNNPVNPVDHVKQSSLLLQINWQEFKKYSDRIYRIIRVGFPDGSQHIPALTAQRLFPCSGLIVFPLSSGERERNPVNPVDPVGNNFFKAFHQTGFTGCWVFSFPRMGKLKNPAPVGAISRVSPFPL
jgi:hypothetical protein